MANLVGGCYRVHHPLRHKLAFPIFVTSRPHLHVRAELLSFDSHLTVPDLQQYSDADLELAYALARRDEFK
jgi:hypothetical protein